MLPNAFLKTSSAIVGIILYTSFAAGATNNYCSGTNWVKGPRLDPFAPIQLRVSLAPSETHGGEEKLLALSDPGNPDFGRYLTSNEVVASFSPGPHVVGNVTAWIQDAGIPTTKIRRTPCGGHIFVEATAEEAEKLLNAEYHHYTHKRTGRVHVGCEHYSVRENVQSLIEFVTPTACTPLSPTIRGPISSSAWGRVHLSSRFRGRPGPSERHIEDFSDIFKRDTSNSTLQVDCSKHTTPDCLRELYGIPLGGPVHPNNSFGIFQPAWSTWVPEDMDKFFEMFQPDLVGQRPVVEAINGGFLQTFLTGSTFNLEPNLDFQYAMALTAPQPVINLQVGDMYQAGTLNNLLASFDSHYCGALDSELDSIYPNPEFPDGYNASDCGAYVAPKVISISYAYDEADFPKQYLRRQCQEYLKLGLMGVTVLAATGDFGPAGADRMCLNHDTRLPDPAAPASNGGLFNPKFPASCPWVTAVGGTQRASDPNEPAARETVYRRQISNHTSSSGGGFSNVFPAPWFQRPHTSTYLRRERGHLSAMEGRFRADGRGIPDVSALASEYVVAVEGKTVKVHGTSASTPVWASIVAKINNERMLAGKSPVGFINPALYIFSSTKRWMSDIRSGYSSGCGFDDAFGAARGWDAGTGLGSPQYKRLLDMFLALP